MGGSGFYQLAFPVSKFPCRLHEMPQLDNEPLFQAAYMARTVQCPQSPRLFLSTALVRTVLLNHPYRTALPVRQFFIHRRLYQPPLAISANDCCTRVNFYDRVVVCACARCLLYPRLNLQRKIDSCPFHALFPQKLLCILFQRDWMWGPGDLIEKVFSCDVFQSWCKGQVDRTHRSPQC